jgi:ATP-dependent helicase/nuclease subunit A
MNEILRPTEETKDRQRRAANPAASAWVSANAGSGKTTVLANRVIRLLLEGHAPSRILCLTFTKAAAANMSNRVFEVLGRWATAPDKKLDEMLADLGERRIDTEMRARARRLFARALDTPGGLKVLTIHAFCERLLHQFPFEAKVPAAFTVLDDRQRDDLVADARAEVLALAASEESGALGAALARLVTETTDTAFAKALNELLMKGDMLARLMRPDGENASARVAARLQQAFGLGQGETTEAIDANIALEIADPAWKKLADWLAASTANNRKTAANIEAMIAAQDADLLYTACQTFCIDSKKQWRAPASLATEKLRTADPDMAELLDRKFGAIRTLIERRRCAVATARALALLTVADAIWSRYAAEKARRGALDFADLIQSARALIKNIGARWVHYKLDQGLDHILVDEAQDTSPAQWDIVQGLTEEFISGEGARDAVRTIFAVGDDKQSIFGFQGAAPEEFARTRRGYQRAHEAAGLGFEFIELTQSFRSTAHVLNAVDCVFAREEARAGLSSDDAAPPTHETARPDAPGRVEIWPIVQPQDIPDSKPWNAPFDEYKQESPPAKLARRIARAVQGWTQGRDALGPCKRIPPGQILILVKARGALFDAILRELKASGLPVAGADRLVLGTHIAVLDLLALADALLLPDDDLALASALKSPLFGLTDDDLLALAPRRKGSLRAALRHDASYREADSRLSSLSVQARRLRPFDFYAALLAAGGGRRAYRARLGHEVDDVLDEFLRLAMSFGEVETATLAGFTAWMRAAPAEIKRDLDTGGGEVRVMTVHGAKGLEAELVVLADLGAERHHSLDPAVYPVRERDAKENEEALPLWSPKKAEDPPALDDAREAEKVRDRGEHRRLLYVAMTRAKDRLVVAGHRGPKTKVEGSWYGLIRTAFELVDEKKFSAETHTVDDLGGEILVYRAPEVHVAAEPAKEETRRPLPAWLTEPMKPERAAPQPLAPSRALEHVFTEGAAQTSVLPAKERGVLLHRLLEELPNIEAGKRKETAGRALARLAPGASETVWTMLADEALAILDAPELAALLALKARAEVAVAGEIAREGQAPLFISGQIDRLIVEDGKVTILDFKSDRPVPADPPESYVAQLALYRVLLAGVFPGKQIEAALLWTANRRLDRIPQERLDAALNRVLGMASVP